MSDRLRAFLFIVFCCCSVPAATACTVAEIPPAGTHNLWYCYTNSDTAIVFVHGFTSDSRQAWYSEREGSDLAAAFWPRIVHDDADLDSRPAPLNEPSIFLAGYPTALDSTTYDMQEAADDLFRALAQPLGGNPPLLDKRNIIFIAHSLGGIVVRDVLVHHLDRWAGKRLGLLLVASPSKGSQYANRLLPPNWFAANKIAEQLQVGSLYLEKLNAAFLKARKPSAPLAELIGKELYEHRILVSAAALNTSSFMRAVRAFAESFATSVWLGPVVDKDSAAAFFPNPELIYDSSHITIAHPQDENDKQQRVFRELYKQVIYAVPAPCRPPQDFNLVVDMALGPWPLSLPDEMPASEKSLYPDLQLVRYDELGAAVGQYTVRRGPRGLYRFPIPDTPFVCPGEKFAANLRRLPARSQLVSESTPTTIACFQRSPDRTNEPFTLLHCREGETCNLDNQRPGLGEVCQKTAVAEARTEATSSTGQVRHWSVPSLQTLEQLPEDARQGYTEFSIQSGPLPENAGATHLSYAVTVNGVPVYMDDLSPQETRIPYSSKGGVHLHFAIENLGFTGGKDGYEAVAVEIRFYKARELLHTAVIERPYISYRHAAEVTVKDANSAATYSWVGFYRPAKVQAAYEVMFVYGPQNVVLHQRDSFDRKALILDGLQTVGVIRPGRKENPTYGMTIGLSLPTGQVKSLFTRQEADKICDWIAGSAELRQQQKDMSYIFEFPAETFTDLQDRGRIAQRCKRT
jgi:pimeloyl-ACP methyl ester carboxylesterase